MVRLRMDFWLLDKEWAPAIQHALVPRAWFSIWTAGGRRSMRLKWSPPIGASSCRVWGEGARFMTCVDSATRIRLPTVWPTAWRCTLIILHTSVDFAPKAEQQLSRCKWRAHVGEEGGEREEEFKAWNALRKARRHKAKPRKARRSGGQGQRGVRRYITMQEGDEGVARRLLSVVSLFNKSLWQARKTGGGNHDE